MCTYALTLCDYEMCGTKKYLHLKEDGVGSRTDLTHQTQILHKHLYFVYRPFSRITHPNVNLNKNNVVITINATCKIQFDYNEF